MWLGGLGSVIGAAVSEIIGAVGAMPGRILYEAIEGGAEGSRESVGASMLVDNVSVFAGDGSEAGRERGGVAISATMKMWWIVRENEKSRCLGMSLRDGMAVYNNVGDGCRVENNIAKNKKEIHDRNEKIVYRFLFSLKPPTLK